MTKATFSRSILWSLAWILTLSAFWRPAVALINLSLQDDRYSHLVLIPFIAGFLIFFDRQRIFEENRWMPRLGIPLFAFTLIICWVARPFAGWSGRNDQLWLPALAIVLVWVSAFLLMNGPKAAAAAIFPLCFLLLMIPIPSVFLDRAVYVLQNGSADLTDVLFRIFGMPEFRSGMRFSLPGVEIEVAKECSGIRSSLALLITGLLASHLFLRSNARKLFFVLLTVPVAILKNAVRIVTLSFLGVYVDRGWLDSPLHHRGGALFALIGLAILLPFLLWLRRSEAASRDSQPLVHGQADPPMSASELT
ncbi:MAG: exosortase/archaeosortase family protein [Bryobacteraceae bacterium]|jgi:exosortase